MPVNVSLPSFPMGRGGRMLFSQQGPEMKTRIALLGCLVLACNVASAHVDCAKAPYGESVAQYGRDEFQLGIIAVTHDDNNPSVPQAMIREIDGAMRAACLAKFYGRNRPRYAKLGLPPHLLKTQSIGSIAALAVDWHRPYRHSSGRVAPATGAPGSSATAGQRAQARDSRRAASAADREYLTVTSNFPACPRKTDLQALLSAALIDESEWPRAEAKGRKYGCIELHAGDHVYPLRRDRWTGLIQVRPDGRARTYWTDTLVVK